LQVVFTFHKILRLGVSGFSYPPKENKLRIFIALKNPSPRTGLNPQTFGPMASTLSLTTPRQLNNLTQKLIFQKVFLNGLSLVQFSLSAMPKGRIYNQAEKNII
jgi:hypothetical protein